MRPQSFPCNYTTWALIDYGQGPLLGVSWMDNQCLQTQPCAAQVSMANTHNICIWISQEGREPTKHISMGLFEENTLGEFKEYLQCKQTSHFSKNNTQPQKRHRSKQWVVILFSKMIVTRDIEPLEQTNCSYLSGANGVNGVADSKVPVSFLTSSLALMVSMALLTVERRPVFLKAHWRLWRQWRCSMHLIGALWH